MPRISTYILLYFVVMLLQTFVFDNLTYSIALTPMVYVTVVLFMPLRTSQLWMLFVGAFVGMSADFVMGIAGINTITTIFLAYIRIYLLSLFKLGGSGGEHKSTPIVTYLRRLGVIFIGVLIHHALFFVFEMLSFQAPLFLLQRTMFSVAVTTLFVALLYDVFSYLTYKSRV
ncbi:MAG: hypothetical protein SNH63_01385 [Rikenellaceae bacterium]